MRVLRRLAEDECEWVTVRVGRGVTRMMREKAVTNSSMRYSRAIRGFGSQGKVFKKTREARTRAKYARLDPGVIWQDCTAL